MVSIGLEVILRIKMPVRGGHCGSSTPPSLDKGIEKGVKRFNSHKIWNCHEKNFTISSHKIWQNIFLPNFLFAEEKMLYITPGLLKLG